MMIIDDWLEDRLSERRSILVPSEDPTDFAMLAGALRAEALAAGYRLPDLEQACGGDIAQFLMTWQNNASPAALAADNPGTMYANAV